MLGAIIGDIAGSCYEFRPTNNYNFEMFGPAADFTDDTICTIGIADAILNSRDYGESLHQWCRRYPEPKGAYGGHFLGWVNSDRPKPYGSFGNGSAMRVSPAGWAFNSREEVLVQAKKTAECTHNHPEGIKGAQTVALAIFEARKRRHSNPSLDNVDIEAIIKACIDFSGYSLDFTLRSVQNKFNETCQGTVPVALWLIAQSSGFEDAVRKAVCLGADADTLGAITGSIAEAIWPVPEELKAKAMTYLSDEMKDIVKAFYARYISL